MWHYLVWVVNSFTKFLHLVDAAQHLSGLLSLLQHFNQLRGAYVPDLISNRRSDFIVSSFYTLALPMGIYYVIVAMQ
jgi:hypothetical protein